MDKIRFVLKVQKIVTKWWVFIWHGVEWCVLTSKISHKFRFYHLRNQATSDKNMSDDTKLYNYNKIFHLYITYHSLISINTVPYNYVCSGNQGRLQWLWKKIYKLHNHDLMFNTPKEHTIVEKNINCPPNLVKKYKKEKFNRNYKTSFSRQSRSFWSFMLAFEHKC